MFKSVGIAGMGCVEGGRFDGVAGVLARLV